MNSKDPDQFLAAYLTLVEQHCVHLVEVAPHADTPELPLDVDNRKILYSWDKEYIVDWDEVRTTVGVCLNNHLNQHGLELDWRTPLSKEAIPMKPISDPWASSTNRWDQAD